MRPRGADHHAYVSFTAEQLQQMAELYTVYKYSFKQLSDKFGICPRTVRNRLVEIGVSIRSKSVSRIPDNMLQPVANLRKKGWGWVDIGKLLGVDTSTAYRWYKSKTV